MTDSELYPVPADWAKRARMGAAGYEAARIAARETPDVFWAEQAKQLDRIRAPTLIKDVSFAKDDFHIRWFADGVLNVAWNCIDRHLPERADQTAILFEGDDPSVSGAVNSQRSKVRVKAGKRMRGAASRHRPQSALIRPGLLAPISRSSATCRPLTTERIPSDQIQARALELLVGSDRSGELIFRAAPVLIPRHSTTRPNET